MNKTFSITFGDTLSALFCFLKHGRVSQQHEDAPA